jgi:ketosteroid isomerase-like protein
MDSSPVAAGAAVGGIGFRNLEIVKEAYRAFAADDFDGGLEALLRHAHADFEMRPYSSPERVVRGADAARAYFGDMRARGTLLAVRGSRFEETCDEVLVHGSLRLLRDGGGLSESQITWVFRFEHGLLRRISGGRRRVA